MTCTGDLNSFRTDINRKPVTVRLWAFLNRKQESAFVVLKFGEFHIFSSVSKNS